jgi:serine protease Do
VAENYHVPIYTYLATWERLAKSEHWGDRRRSRAWIGAWGFDHPQGCMLERVSEGGPAFKAGLKVGDIITKLSSTPIEDNSALIEFIADSQPGDEVTMEVFREGLGMGMLLTIEERRRGRGGRGGP